MINLAKNILNFCSRRNKSNRKIKLSNSYQKKISYKAENIIRLQSDQKKKNISSKKSIKFTEKELVFSDHSYNLNHDYKILRKIGQFSSKYELCLSLFRIKKERFSKEKQMFEILKLEYKFFQESIGI